MRTSSCTCMKRFSKMFSCDLADAFGLGGEGHVLGLHVGGKAGILFGGDVGGVDRSLPSLRTRTEFGPRMSGGAGLLQAWRSRRRGDQGCSRRRTRSPRVMAPAMRKVRLHTVGIDAVMRAVKLGDAVDVDGGRSSAFDLRSHGNEEGGEIADFGLASAVFHQGFAFGEGGHEQIFSAGDGDFVEDDVRAFERLVRASR